MNTIDMLPKISQWNGSPVVSDLFTADWVVNNHAGLKNWSAECEACIEATLGVGVSRISRQVT